MLVQFMDEAREGPRLHDQHPRVDCSKDRATGQPIQGRREVKTYGGLTTQMPSDESNKSGSMTYESSVRRRAMNG